jgi:excisionase family DNA binding protein
MTSTAAQPVCAELLTARIQGYTCCPVSIRMWATAQMSDAGRANMTTPIVAESLQVELLTVSELAQLLKVPVSWVYKHSRARGAERIPHVKLGKYLRFRESEVRVWIDKNFRSF